MTSPPSPWRHPSIVVPAVLAASACALALVGHPQAAALLGAVCAIGVAGARAGWRAMAGSSDAHRFWACAVGVAVLWHLDAGPFRGVHLLGATVVCALLGLRIGLVALAIGTAIRHLGDGLPWIDWGGAFLLGGALPVLIARPLIGLARRAGPALGPLPLVGASFVAGGVSMSVAAGTRAWLHGAPLTGALAGPDVAALVVAMAIAEANLSAGLLATIAAQRPDWLSGPGRRA